MSQSISKGQRRKSSISVDVDTAKPGEIISKLEFIILQIHICLFIGPEYRKKKTFIPEKSEIHASNRLKNKRTELKSADKVKQK